MVKLVHRLEKLNLIAKRERFGLTWRGAWLLLALILGIGGESAYFLAHHLVGFLARTQPIAATALVIEGWIPDYALEDVKAEFVRGAYRLLIITGNPISKGEPLAEYKNYATLTRAILLREGWDPKQVVAVTSDEMLRDRTFASAYALRQWLCDHSDLGIHSINVLSFGVHTRRTWLLYDRALAGVAAVGSIAGKDLRFDPAHWWKSSEGVRMTLDETIAYIYARWLFAPH